MKKIKPTARARKAVTQTQHISRLMNLYHYLHAEQKACSLDEMRTHPKIGHWYNDDIDESSIKRTIRRDLEKLSEILGTGHLQTIKGIGNQPDQYSLSADASIEPMSSEQALILVMANDYVRQYLPREIYTKVEGMFYSATRRLEKNTKLNDWRSRIQFIMSGPQELSQMIMKNSETTNSNINKIYTALLENKYWLKCSYYKERQHNRTEYELKPHGIIQDGHKQYLMASKIVGNKSELRTFNMQRFFKVELIDERITVDVNSFDLERLVCEKEHEMAYFDREYIRIQLRCKNHLKDEVVLYFYGGHEMEIQRLDEDYFLFNTDCIITQSVLDWLVEKSHSIQVLESQELFEKVKEHVMAAFDYYDCDYEDLEEYKEEFWKLESEPLFEQLSDNEIIELFDDLSEALPSTELLDLDSDEEENVRLFEFFRENNVHKLDTTMNMAIGVGYYNIEDFFWENIFIDLLAARHLLIAGAEYSGKTTTIKAMLLSILLKYTPKQLRLILINPEWMKLEFSHYRDIPHLLMPLMSKMEQAMNALDWCVQETERRYQLLSLLRVRNIDGYNQKVCESNNQDSVLPRIVIVIDEFSDLMLKIGKKAETVLARLTQKSSIVGIHLILVTQHLSSSVITDAIKENIPTRIAFRVSNKTESNLILGKSGAEDLLEDGAMLINSSKKSDFNEIKGIFVSRKEEYRICHAWRRRGEPEYVMNNIQLSKNEEDLFMDFDQGHLNQDELYQACVSFILETRQVSISGLQRQFNLDYNRTARIIDEMEANGIISPMQKDGLRLILV